MFAMTRKIGTNEWEFLCYCNSPEAHQPFTNVELEYCWFYIALV